MFCNSYKVKVCDLSLLVRDDSISMQQKSQGGPPCFQDTVDWLNWEMIQRV